ncbi:MAG: hypothetical protein ACTS44_00905 [Candidatus Hodgkinia cicadicola]
MFTNIAQTSRFGRSFVFTSAEAPWPPSANIDCQRLSVSSSIELSAA